MKVVTAIEDYELSRDEISVFLAGGITNCQEWQDKIISLLKDEIDTDKLVVFNPRRKNFPIGDPSASYKQIDWEYRQLERMDIFSMYFAGGESDQPICMYELGRNIIRMQNRFPIDWSNRIVVSVESDYKRKQDVLIQTDLATGHRVYVNTQISKDILMDYHADYICRAYKRLLNA